MSHQNSRPNNGAGSFYGQQPGKMVTKTNVKGQCQDKLTANQLKPEVNPHATTYNEDYSSSLGGSMNKSQKGQKSEGKLAVNNNYGAQYASAKNLPAQPVANQNVRINQANEILNQQKVEKNSDSGSKANKIQSSANFFETGGSKKFDTTTMYDPECVHEDVKKSFVSNPNIKCDNEAEYYETVRRLDVCGRCWTGQQKYCTAPFKLKQKGPTASLYQKDYKEHPIQTGGPEIKNDFYNTFNIEEPMDLKTNNRNDYTAKKIEPTEPFNHNKPPKASVPFAGRAGSKADYINWGNMPVHYEKAPNNISVIPELPLLAKTSYGENFGNKFPYERARPVDRDLWKNKTKSPLSPGIPFLAQTTSQRAFKPFRVEGNQNGNKKAEFEPTEAYPDQYRSTYDQDFISHGKWKCPARVFLDTHPHPRSKYLEV